MKKQTINFVIGMLAGAMLFSGRIAYAAGVMAEHTPQQVYVDGKAVQMDAYSINGYNYVKLRDVGEAVGFNVYWDSKSIQVDSGAPYTGTNPNGQSTNQTTDERGLTYNADGSINVPQDGSKYIPQEGDVVRCDDGTNYTITNVLRYDNNVFAPGPVGPLPTPTCDWSAFPNPEMPRAEVRHFTNSNGEVMFIRNPFETRRMQYTIYNALGEEPSAWQNGKPLATVALTIDPKEEPFVKASWPWRASDLESLVFSRPVSRYYVEAWDYYSKGVFQYTRYCVLSL